MPGTGPAGSRRCCANSGDRTIRPADRDAGDELSDDQQVARSAVGQNDALQRQSYPDFRNYTCEAQFGKEADILAQQRDSAAKQGERFVDSVTDVVIDGDRATAKVTYYFDKAPDTKTDVEISFVRQGGAWKVCSTGSR